MTAGAYSFSIEQGTDWSIDCAWADDQGNPLTLSNVLAQIGTSPATALTVGTVAANEFTLSLTASQTGVLTVGTYPWDCFVTQSGARVRLLAGKATVIKRTSQ